MPTPIHPKAKLSQSKDALKSYFDELLTAVADDTYSASKYVENVLSGKVEAVDDEQSVRESDVTLPSLVRSSGTSLSPESVSGALSESTTRSDASLGQENQPRARTEEPVAAGLVRPALEPERKLQKRPERALQMSPEREALREEQKRKLQALLNQQTLRQTQAQTETPKTSSVAVEKTIETEDVVKRKIHDIEQGLALGQHELEPDSVLYDSFHSAQAHKVEWAANGRPEWAQQAFDALLFDVGGLTLAVPLVALGQIVPLDQGALTPIFGQSDWFMGILPTNLGRLRIVNTALFVMPEKYDDCFVQNAEYAISLDGVPWALAVNKVNQPIRLEPEEIKWRSERSKRPWLAGTVKSAMCALIDVPRMAALLNDSDRQLKHGL